MSDTTGNNTEEPTVIIDDETEPIEQAKEGQTVDEELSPGEIELAKKHGLIVADEKEKLEDGKIEVEDGEHKELPDAKTKEDGGKKEEVEKPTFDQVEADEKLIDKYDKNGKALYWKWKTDKHKRQEAQKKVSELEEKLKEAVDSGVSGKKLDKIKDLLKTPDSLTIEALQAVLEEKVEPEKKDHELNNAQAIQQKVAIKAQFAEKIGSAKYDNFDKISNLAKEIILADASKTYQKLIDESFLNDDVDENMLVERVVSIARMSPKFNDVVNQVDPEAKKKADRIIENSKKKVSSASMTGSSGKRIISESELTVEQATKLSTQQWNKLKPETRERILKGNNP